MGLRYTRRPVSTESSARKRWPWCVLIGLLVFSVPWYWPDGVARPFLLGLPAWAFVSLAMSLLFAGVVAWMILRLWKDE
jgi:hypothetical protein